MTSPLSLAEYKSITTINTSIVDVCAAKGKSVQTWLNLKWAHVKSRLVKRYSVDFTAPGPVPEKIVEWLVVLVDIEVWKCVGGNPEGREDGWYDKDRDRVEAELKEAADADTGLFELPLRNTDPTGASAVSKGGPLVESFNTVHGWFDAQALARDGGGW
jgi:hypothetical protein